MTEKAIGVFWKQEDEYRVQISFPSGTEDRVVDMFPGWLNVGKGIDTTKDREILIFKKVFTNSDDFGQFIRDMNNNNIIMKEAA